MRAIASKMARIFSASVVIGFSVITSRPSSIARTTYWWCVASTVVTMTVSGSVSAIMRSKLSAS